MGYFDDYGSSRTKIPYDDVPITRNERAKRNNGSSRGGSRMSKTAPSFIVSFGLIINLVLSVVCLFLVGTKKYRTINNYVIEVGAGSEVSMAVKNSAIANSVCITSGTSSNVSSGSGVIYKIDRNSENVESSAYNKGTIYFVTCYHVVENDTKNVKVQLSSYTSKESIKVSIVGYSSKYDIAVLKYVSNDLNETLWGCSATTVFDSSYATQGECVFAVGNPLGLGITITDGLISQLNAFISIEKSEPSRCIKISAEINPGNSGGGLFNSKGELVGIVNAKLDEASSGKETFVVEGTSYAIPSSVVRGIADRLIAGEGSVKYLDLNVTFASVSRKTIEPIIYNNETRLVETYAVKVSSVGKGIASGKLTTNDYITKIVYIDVLTNEEKTQMMYNQYSYEDCVFSIKPYSTVKFYIDGKTEPVEIVASSFNTV